MKKLRLKKSAAAFTLIELLVVIAIIGILAGLVVGIAGLVSGKGKISRVQADLAQIKTAIESYKGKRGHYPPDSPISDQKNALYYELVGATKTNSATEYTTLDWVDIVPDSVFLPAGMLGTLGVSGIANSSEGLQSDNAAGAETFLKNIKPSQVVTITSGVDSIKLLNVGVLGTDGSITNPWHYNSHNPTNNPDSYDLWAEILIGRKTNTICNWSDTPIVK